MEGNRFKLFEPWLVLFAPYHLDSTPLWCNIVSTPRTTLYLRQCFCSLCSTVGFAWVTFAWSKISPDSHGFEVPSNLDKYRKWHASQQQNMKSWLHFIHLMQSLLWQASVAYHKEVARGSLPQQQAGTVHQGGMANFIHMAESVSWGRNILPFQNSTELVYISGP